MSSKLAREGQRGQGLVEYALILVLVAIVVIVVLVTLGPSLNGVYCTVIQELNSDSTCTTAAVAAEQTNKQAEQDIEKKPSQPGVVTVSYTCERVGDLIRFAAFYSGQTSPFYQSPVFQCEIGSHFSVDIPYTDGQHGEVETNRITPNPGNLAIVSF